MERSTCAREDYRELLELAVVFLGGAEKRLRGDRVTVIQPSIRKPGAIHQARLMASSLVYSQEYILKIYLFQHQYNTACENIKQVDRFSNKSTA